MSGLRPSLASAQRRPSLSHGGLPQRRSLAAADRGARRGSGRKSRGGRVTADVAPRHCCPSPPSLDVGQPTPPGWTPRGQAEAGCPQHFPEMGVNPRKGQTVWKSKSIPAHAQELIISLLIIGRSELLGKCRPRVYWLPLGITLRDKRPQGSHRPTRARGAARPRGLSACDRRPSGPTENVE